VKASLSIIVYLFNDIFFFAFPSLFIFFVFPEKSFKNYFRLRKTCKFDILFLKKCYLFIYFAFPNLFLFEIFSSKN
jgi:hypothetical protein